MGGLASHPYTMSKEAILGLARSTACELGVHGIRVNCISPHGVPSEMLVSEFQKFLGNTELRPNEVSSIVGERGSLLRGRGGRLEDVAQAVLFLASDESGFVRGGTTRVQGGSTESIKLTCKLRNLLRSQLGSEPTSRMLVTANQSLLCSILTFLHKDQSVNLSILRIPNNRNAPVP
ncbi:hypothetical protein H5410_055740 [Solanum commersonii]|uniref:Uncharacterized protein n=1 Tax=Solanum commersonii TaxID=4109 RepID=A0A9J5WL42_SOLCO|nr:hypothetical protein H5410_055740 [Solanum commersonii]